MRPGHKWSGRFEKGFEADTEFLIVPKAVQEGQLIDKDGSQGKALGSEQAFGGNLSMSVKDALEVFIKIFHGDGTELMKDASHLDAIIPMRIASIFGRYQQTVISLTEHMEFRGVVMAISQHEADFGGNFAQQIGGRLTISDIGRSEHCGHRKPDRRNHRNDMQFLAIDPTMPARLGPMGFRIN